MFVAASGTTWFFATDILIFLLKPVEGELSPFPGGPPVFTSPTGIFAVTIDLAVRTGVLVALPFFVIGLYKITPAFPRLSNRFLLLYLPAVLGLYAAGLAFVYFVMVPRGMGFLLSFGTDVAVPLITINSYFNLLKNLLLFVPLAFQLPVVMWLLAKARILSYRRLRMFRKVVPLGLGIFTAIITPTVDVVNFLIMWIPMLLLFELGMFLMWIQAPEQGNYLWVKTVRDVIVWVRRRPAVAYNKVTWILWRRWR